MKHGQSFKTMAITINGNGTVTGISVGGLPDGIVDTDMLASNAVTEPKLGPGSIIKVTHGTNNTTGMSTTNTSFTNYANSEITVTKTRGSGSGGSILLVLGNAWLEYSGSGVNSKHLYYSVMRDGTELTGLSGGCGNLYSGNANGYQGHADIKYMDSANLNAGNYVYSMCIKGESSITVQIGNAGRLGTWQILEIAT